MEQENPVITKAATPAAPSATGLLWQGARQIGSGAAVLATSRLLPGGVLRKTAALASGLMLAKGVLNILTAVAVKNLSDKAVPEKRRKAVVDGIVMQWEEHGETGDEALPVVFVHGIPSHPRAWRYVIPLINKPGIRCLAWELVGFGWSVNAGLVRDISPAQQALYLKSWLQHMNIKRAIFVGHDFGGGVLQALLTAEPERALALVLSDAVAYDNWPVPMVRLSRSLADVLEYLPAFLVKPFYLAALLNLGHDRFLPLLESAWVHWQPYKHTQAAKGLAQQARHARQEDTLQIAHKLPELAKRTFPKTVIWGMKDPLGVASAKRLAGDIDAQLQLIPGGRHFTLENHAPLIARAVNRSITIVSVRKDAGVTSVSHLKEVE